MYEEASPKIFQMGAYKQEPGLTGVSQSLGWGDSDSWQTPGAGDGFPWLSLGNQPTVNKVDDLSIKGNAAKTAPRLVSLRVDQELSFLARFYDIDYWFYWTFGFQNEILEVVVFEKDTTGSPWGSSEPAAGTVFEDDNSKKFTYSRTFQGKDLLGELKDYYVFIATDSLAPVSTLKTLTEESPGTETFTYTDNSTVLYEKLYELDKLGRQYREYETAEQVTGWSSGDKKNLMVTICKRFAKYDLRYGNAMCRAFTFNCPTEDMARWETNFLAYKPDRSEDVNGDPVKNGYGSNTWTIPTSLEDNETALAHYQSVFEIGETVGSLTTECVTDVSIAVDMPLQQIQDTCSGLYLADPVIEGHYDIKLNATISRHESTVYQHYRDENTRLFARYGFNWGWFSLEFLMKNIVITTAGSDDSDVAAEPLEGMVSSCAAADDQWATSDWLYGHSQVQNMPLVLRVINDNNNNEMFNV